MRAAGGASCAAVGGVGDRVGHRRNCACWDAVRDSWWAAVVTGHPVVPFEPACCCESGKNLVGLSAGEVGGIHNLVPVVLAREVVEKQFQDRKDSGCDTHSNHNRL